VLLEGGGHGHAQDVGRVARGRHLTARTVGQTHDLVGVRGEPAAACGQRDACAGAHDEGVAEVSAQCRHGSGHGGFADAEGTRRRTHRAEPRDERERPQLAQRHAAQDTTVEHLSVRLSRS
jgi:hypothetical protein